MMVMVTSVAAGLGAVILPAAIRVRREEVIWAVASSRRSSKMP
jgi:hypothetical protein